MVLPPLLLFALLWLGQVVLPGPNFVRITTAAMHGSRQAALQTAAGTAAANALWCLAAALGAAALLANPALASAVRLAGAAYLALYGLQLWRGALGPRGSAAASGRPLNARAAFSGGFATAAASPQALVFFTSIFSSLFTDLSAGLVVSAMLVAATANLAWYLVVIPIVTTPALRDHYLRLRPIIEIVFGGLLLLSAWKLAAMAL
ncbi:MAG: LysE family transporter [Caulobacter sp.]